MSAHHAFGVVDIDPISDGLRHAFACGHTTMIPAVEWRSFPTERHFRTEMLARRCQLCTQHQSLFSFDAYLSHAETGGNTDAYGHVPKDGAL